MAKRKSSCLGWIAVAVVFGCVALLVLAMRSSSVKRVNRADPKLQAAAREAQGRMGEFLQEFQHPKPGDAFAIKGEFRTDAGPEYLWVKHLQYQSGMFTGVLDQTPIATRKMRRGDVVRVALANVYDWLIDRDGVIEGEFTEKALQGG